MALTTAALGLTCFLLLLIVPSAIAKDPCVYTVYVRTGSVWKGGTDAKISAGFYDDNGFYLQIQDLESWGGLMGPDHDYYERGNLDIFSGLGECLTGRICGLNLTSDGAGKHAGWYCNYVEVTMAGAHLPCVQKDFQVEQWLALDASPYQLTALRSDCTFPLPSNRSSATAAEASLPRIMEKDVM